MFVAEMRTYMQDIDGTNQMDPVSRISMHTDTDGDGTYDKHTVFIDKLLLPRMILPLDDRLIVCETNTLDFYSYRDTDGDGVADQKELFYKGGPRGGNLEHQPSGLIWGMDNWLYLTTDGVRLRMTPDGVVKDSIANNGGQWGLTQDDYGKPWFTNAGGERGPLNFQAHIAYGSFALPGEFAENFREVWPLVGLADVEGGARRFRPEDKTLNHFTATCGQEIYRGDKLPDLRGDLLFAEPVGRLIRRARVQLEEGVVKLSNPYEKSEFIRSSDPNFRPVNMVTAPDGSLYIVDMYRGIIQEGNWVRPGSFLRKQVEQHGLDKNVGRGRIYRLVREKTPPAKQPRMLEETPHQLVAHLAHPNGWWRDTAQKLLVLRNDKSVVPELTKMAQTHVDHLARLHALWTIEGLGALTPEIVSRATKDEHPQLRAAAIRVSEPFLKKGSSELLADVRALAKDGDSEVSKQLILSSKRADFPEHKTLIAEVASATRLDSIKTIADTTLNPRQPAASGWQLTAEEKKMLKAGGEAFASLCAACHGADAKGTPMAGGPAGTLMAPPLAGSKTINGHRDGPINVLLRGLAGPIDGKTYDSLMVPMADQTDEWIASVLSYVRTNFGNKAGLITAADVAKVRAKSSTRTEPWTMPELQTVTPQAITDRAQWKITASGGRKLDATIDGDPNTRFDTAAFQKPGMWLQVELPQEAKVSGVLLDTTASANDYPRGYRVQLSADGAAWSEPVASGRGIGPITELAFNATPAKFVRITQTGSAEGSFWSVHELQLYALP
jgi:mono/diheme cytochrome c family protein